MTLARPDDDNWTRVILEALNDQVEIGALPHVHWTDGALIDLKRVCRRCREVGAALVIDGTPSVGALPFDVCIHHKLKLKLAREKPHENHPD